MSNERKTPWAPGPWSYRYDGEHWNDKDSFYLVANPSGRIGGHRDIALILGDHTGPCTEANARLAARAPDLADALQRLVDSHVATINEIGAVRWDPEKEPEVILARALLQQIRGDQ